MSNEHDQPDDYWESEGEVEASPPFRTTNQPRPSTRSHSAPQPPPETPEYPLTRPRPRGVPGAGSMYEEEEDDELTARDPRTTRQAHKEALARVRQRPRQPLPSHNPEEPRARSAPPASKTGHTARLHHDHSEDHPSHTSRVRRDYGEDHPSHTTRLYRDHSEDYAERPTTLLRPPRTYEPYDDEYERYEQHAGYGTARQQRAYASSHQPYQRPRRRRRTGSRILTGCVGVLLTLAALVAVGAYYVLHNTPLGQSFGQTTYTQQISQAIALGNASEVIIKNQIGNVSITVGGNASNASLTSMRKVQAHSQSEADSQFSKIVLSTQQISQGADPACTASACVRITATLPPATNASNLFGPINTASIDLTLTLPSNFNSPDPTKPATLSASTASGDLSVSGFNGILYFTGNSGAIHVTHTLIFAGTCLQTMQGDITIGQGSIFDLNQPSNQIPCSPTTSSGVHPWFNITSGRGNVAIALTAPSTNLLLDANTNDGKINDDFGVNIPSNSDGSASYHGPLVPNGTPTASLYVFTSTGNIAIQQA